MKRHSNQGHRDTAQGEQGAAARPRTPHRRSSKKAAGPAPSHRRRPPEPDPIRVPPGWRLSPERARRRKILRIAGKVTLALGGFALLTLPFVINHLDRGAFYYQEVPVEIPVALPVESPPAVPAGLELPTAPAETSPIIPADLGASSRDADASPDSLTEPAIDSPATVDEPAPVANPEAVPVD